MGPLRLFGRLAAASFQGQARYPGTALMLALAQFLATGVEAVGLWALFDRFGHIQGWQLGEVAVFYGLANIMFALADTLGRGFDVLGTELIRTGGFDRLLLRPRPLALQLMVHDLRLSRLGRLLQGAGVLAFGWVQCGMGLTLSHGALLAFALAGGTALLLGILVLQGTLSFWTVEGLEIANVLTYGSVQAAQMPLSVYAAWFRRVLTFIVPLACVAYYPVLALLGRADPLGAPAWVGWVSPVAGFAFLAAALQAWRLGLKRYASTGS